MHPLLDVSDRLARVEVFRARLSAVHDGVTPFFGRSPRGVTRRHGTREKIARGRGGGVNVEGYMNSRVNKKCRLTTWCVLALQTGT